MVKGIVQDSVIHGFPHTMLSVSLSLFFMALSLTRNTVCRLLVLLIVGSINHAVCC